MRDPMSHDSVPMPLGPPIRRERVTEAKPRQISPGIFEANGRLYTDMPEPTAPPTPAPQPQGADA